MEIIVKKQVTEFFNFLRYDQKLEQSKSGCQNHKLF